MPKTKTTVYLEESLLRAAKIRAARRGMKEYEVFEDALKAYLGFETLQRVWSQSSLGEDEALEIAYQELHRTRRKPR